MDKLSYYINNYCSRDDIDYLIGIIGKVEALDFNFNEKNAKNILSDMENDMKFLTIFHNLYDIIINEHIPINRDILSGLKELNEGYFELMKKYEKAEKKINDSKAFSLDRTLEELSKRLEKMSENLDGHPYKNTAFLVTSDRGKFSLSEEFSIENGKHYQTDLNAVTVITPSQTISRFNSTEVNGLMGSGYHDNNFREITRSVYGKDLGISGTSGQDIKIRYVNDIRKQSPFMITLEVPIYINSSQKMSLEMLNEEIKKFEKSSGMNISINTIIVDYEDGFRNALPIEDDVNLDEALRKINVDDYHELKEEEIYLVGYPNNENHYESSFKLDVGVKREFEESKRRYTESNPNLRLVVNNLDSKHK